MSDEKKPLITAERVRLLFNYDKSSGVFTRRVKTSNSTHVGQIVGSQHNQGYLSVRIDGRSYLCHRLAWLCAYGRWPTDQLDHINGNRTDNRIANLRECSNAENCQNVKAHKDGIGLLGVSFDKRTRRWIGQLTVNGKRVWTKRFDTPQLAHDAYKEAKLKYHPMGTVS